MASTAPLTPESLAPLLQSNDAPEPIQKVLVNEILRTKAAELSALESEISALQSRVQTLQRSHATLVSDMQRYSGILSPIRQLPPEIIAHIFLYFVPSWGSDFPETAAHGYMHGYGSGDALPRVDPPWTLGQICGVWRAVALSLGQLWAV
ncbi:hypothetical protein B0H17DRAFT_942479, partial [Mycena rosella]